MFRSCPRIMTLMNFLKRIEALKNTRGHNMRFMQPMTRTDSYLHSFFPSAIKIWNSLPQYVIDSKDIDEFKQTSGTSNNNLIYS